MTQSLIWLHGDALRRNHPVFEKAPTECDAVYIWDNAYLQQTLYSLKRLIFLYETLCELEVEIVKSDMDYYLQTHPAQTIYMPSSPDPLLKKIAQRLAQEKNLVLVAEEAFVNIELSYQCRRFFHYWSKAEKTAFKHNADLYV